MPNLKTQLLLSQAKSIYNKNTTNRISIAPDFFIVFFIGTLYTQMLILLERIFLL